MEGHAAQFAERLSLAVCQFPREVTVLRLPEQAELTGTFAEREPIAIHPPWR